MRTVGVCAETHLIVSYDLSLRGGRKGGVPGIGIGDVLQQVFGRLRPDTLWNDVARKNAGVGIAGTNVVAKFLRQKIGEIRPTYRARESLVAEISYPVGERWDSDVPRIDSRGRSGTLIIAKKEQFVLGNRPAYCPAELVLPVHAALRRKEAARIESRIAQEFESAAVPLIGS